MKIWQNYSPGETGEAGEDGEGLHLGSLFPEELQERGDKETSITWKTWV